MKAMLEGLTGEERNGVLGEPRQGSVPALGQGHLHSQQRLQPNSASAAVEPSRAHGPEKRTCLSGSDSSIGHSTRVRNGVFPAISVNKAVTVIIHFGPPNVNF